MPLALDPSSEPEPDISVVAGSWRDFLGHHPRAAVLVVEIAETTLAYDRDRKGSLYARLGVPEHWVVNLRDRRVEVYRDPAPSPEARYGWSYRSVEHLSSGQTIAPLAAPEAAVRTVDLLD
jgi:Uma2 family endonuclease